jgi:hypothetical protein
LEQVLREELLGIFGFRGYEERDTVLPKVTLTEEAMEALIAQWFAHKIKALVAPSLNKRNARRKPSLDDSDDEEEDIDRANLAAVRGKTVLAVLQNRDSTHEVKMVALVQSLDEIFPLPLAWNPGVSPLIEFSAADNAAYAVGNNFFVLLPDGQHRDVPLLANRGVVAHELGHAVFHLLTAGGPFAPMLVEDPSSTAGRWQSSLHEAFADVQAALLTDDPAFISASLDMPARDLSQEHVMTEAILPDNGSQFLYDPYPAGTVFASLLWELRVQTDDADGSYQLLLSTARAWRPETVDGASWMETLLDQADPDQREILCEAAIRRLGDFWESGGSCP